MRRESERLAEVAGQVRALGEVLTDLAFDRLREASAEVSAGREPDPALIAEEKRITRARRALEKAAALLEG